jgi:hypothetical protein
MLPWLYVIMRPPPPELLLRNPPGRASSLHLAPASLSSEGKRLCGQFDQVLKYQALLLSYCKQNGIDPDTRILQLEQHAWIPLEAMRVDRANAQAEEQEAEACHKESPASAEPEEAHRRPRRKLFQRDRKKHARCYDVPRPCIELGEDVAAAMLSQVTKFLGVFMPAPLRCLWLFPTVRMWLQVAARRWQRRLADNFDGRFTDQHGLGLQQTDLMRTCRAWLPIAKESACCHRHLRRHSWHGEDHAGHCCV